MIQTMSSFHRKTLFPSHNHVDNIAKYLILAGGGGGGGGGCYI